MMLFGSNKVLLYFILFFFLFSKNVLGIENKILFKINNEIITSLDVKNEISYIRAFNKRSNNLSDNDIDKIAKNSLIIEKTKEMELLKFIKNIEINNDDLKKLIRSNFEKLGFKSKNQFIEYLKTYNLQIYNLERKISIQILWNQLIFSKFSKDIKIDRKKLREKILKTANKKIKSYSLSEILFNVDKNEELKKKYAQIKESIIKVGFENTVLIYSISDSSKNNGNLGWIEERILNKKILNQLTLINTGQITEPIINPGGFLVLKINDIKFTNEKINIEEKLKKLVNLETNQQLNQKSNIYFNKIKKNYLINEL